jgi:quercetin dioxygenase-like cupin family protein
VHPISLNRQAGSAADSSGRSRAIGRSEGCCGVQTAARRGGSVEGQSPGRDTVVRSSTSESYVAIGIHAELPISSGAITSRTLLNNAAVRVVAFAMDQGQELTDHSSPRPVVVQVVEGDLVLTVDGASHGLGAGDMVYLAPSARHSVEAVTPCRFVLVMSMTEAEEHDPARSA